MGIFRNNFVNVEGVVFANLKEVCLVLPMMFFLSSCGHVTKVKYGFVPVKTSVYNVNGASVSSEVVPSKSSDGVGLSAMIYFYGKTSVKGPYRVFLKADGDSSHNYFGVHSMRYKFSDDSDYKEVESSLLFGSLPFWSVKKKLVDNDDGLTAAFYRSPFKISSSRKKFVDLGLELVVNVSVRTDESVIYKDLVFNFKSDKVKETEFISIPKEIRNKFKKKK